MKLPTKLLALAAAGVVLTAGAVGAVGYVSAQEGGSTPQAQDQTLKDDFLNKLAANLNVTPDQLKAALKTTGLQTVDDLVANGKLTQDQANKIKDRINSGQGGGLRGLLGRIKHHRQVRAEFRKQVVESSATAIGISADDLRTEFKSGKSIADVAGEHNVSVDAVKSQITTDVQAKLNQAVQNGKITQDRADTAMQKLTDNLDKIINATKSG